MRLYAISVIILLAATATFAVEQKAGTDARLSQKVTYNAKGQLLYKVIGGLSAKTGVTMNCGRNAKDWQVRDRKVSVFVKEMPLSELQSTLASLLHFTWSEFKGKDGVTTYRIFQDLKARTEEDALRTQLADDEAKKASKVRQTALSDIAKLDSLSPEEIEKLKTDAPLLYVLAKEPFGQGLRHMFANMPPDAQAAMSQGQDTTMDLSKMSPAMVQSTSEMVSGLDALVAGIGPSGRPSFSGLLDNIGNAKVSFKQLPQGSTPDEAQAKVRDLLGVLEVKAEGQSPAELPLFNPRSPTGDVMGKIIMLAQEGLDPADFQARIAEVAKPFMAKAMNPDQPTDDPLPSDPDLEKTVKLELTKPSTEPEVLEEIAKKSELQIVSDYFVNTKQAPLVKEDKLGPVLDSVATAQGKHVTKTGNLVTFVDKKWFIKRSWEVPEASLENWRALTKEGTLSIGDFADIAALSDGQIAHTIGTDKVLGTVWRPANSALGILRLYGVLTDAQRRSVASEDGLDPATLSAEQTPYFEHILGKLDSGKVEGVSQFALFLDETPATYSFTLKDRASEAADDKGAKVVSAWTIVRPKKAPKNEPKPQSEKPKH